MAIRPSTTLRKAMAEARDAGMDPADMHSMVTDVYTTAPDPADPAEPACDVVYDALPDGLIDLPTACREHGVNIQTANGWWRKTADTPIGQAARTGARRRVQRHF